MVRSTKILFKKSEVRVLNKTEKLLIDLLAYFAGNNSVKIDTEDVDGEKLLDLAKKHGVAGIVGYVVNKQGIFENEDIKKKLTNEYDRTIMKMSGKEYGAERLCDVFSENDIPHILYKGTTVGECYPIRELRTFGDVDMLIHDSDKDKVCRLMRSLGYDYRIEDGGVVNSFSKGQEKYEIHTALNIPDSEANCFKNPWDNTTIRSRETRVFEHNFHLSFLISHIEKHLRGSGAGLRMYLDIALYIKAHSDETDLEKVRERLAECGLDRILETVLYVCKEWFGSEIPEWVNALDDEVYKQFCDFTLSGGVFGNQSTDENIRTALRNELSNGRKGAKLRLLFAKIFPPRTELMRIYPPSDEKEFSAVSAWFRHTGDVIKNKKLSRIKEIASVDMASAEGKKEFLSSLGCKS